MLEKAKSLKEYPNEEIYNELVKEAIEIHNEDRELCLNIGKNGMID